MKLYTDFDVVREARFYEAGKVGIIKTAKLLGMPKSTLHYHLRKRLKSIDYDLWFKVKFKRMHGRKRV